MVAAKGINPRGAGFRMLPDGTFLNERTGTVAAPKVDAPRMSATAGPTAPWEYKTQPSPARGANGAPIAIDPPNPELMAGLAGYNTILPGGGGMHMRHGRNYPALGEAPAVPMSRKLLCVGAIIGVAALTVWLQNMGKKKKT